MDAPHNTASPLKSTSEKGRNAKSAAATLPPAARHEERMQRLTKAAQPATPSFSLRISFRTGTIRRNQARTNAFCRTARQNCPLVLSQTIFLLYFENKERYIQGLKKMTP
ncbi:MAG TPA: hypothetical protein IAB01_07830 [Candidatus Avidesulfovibrio excrementigallinarum]|nr:hypothetical protein [Candidatus Avidesulfovibrio excrementigallinarum]